MYSLVPFVFRKFVEERPWFATFSLVMSLDSKKVGSAFKNLSIMRSSGIVTPMVRFSASREGMKR